MGSDLELGGRNLQPRHAADLSGLFDRYPDVRVILGHMGETLPIQLSRLDSRLPASHQIVTLKKKPSDYVRENIRITTSAFAPMQRCAARSMRWGGECDVLDRLSLRGHQDRHRLDQRGSDQRSRAGASLSPERHDNPSPLDRPPPPSDGKTAKTNWTDNGQASRRPEKLMKNPSGDGRNPSRRTLIVSGAALLGTAAIPQETVASAPQTIPAAPVVVAPPGGYNILFILVDQEHFFERWPMPVPGREWIKQNGITFTNHQAASCVCSPARSTIYSGQHIQLTGIFDNAGSLWQADMSTDVKTIGHRLAELGYHAAYQGKWHLSNNLDQAKEAIDAPFADYRKIIKSYGFEDFFGVGDINDTTLGGYNYDDTTTAFVTRWLRTKGEALRAAGRPWYLAVNFVNPHDVMYVDSDLPGETIQGRTNSMPIARPPQAGAKLPGLRLPRCRPCMVD